MNNVAYLRALGYSTSTKNQKAMAKTWLSYNQAVLKAATKQSEINKYTAAVAANQDIISNGP
jgi:hypothetical protein